MANTTIALRSSGVTGNVPSLGVIENGELSLNYADGILYYKTASNTLGSIRTTEPAGLTTEVQFNDAGSLGSNASFTYDKTTGTLTVPILRASAGGGPEGGQIELANSSTGSLQGPVAIDVYDNKLRIFETSGTNRGVYIDLFSAGAGVGTDLLGGAAGVSSIGGASGVVSNTQLLSFITTVDGSGSGLDADLLDGQHASYYSTNAYAISAYTQANTANTNAVNAGTYANAAFAQANTANTNAVNAGTYANAAFAQANTANTRAYATVLKTGDTISGDLVIQGNVSVDAIIFPDGTTQNTASAGGGSAYNTSLLFTKADGSTANMTLRVADTQLTSALNSVYVPFLLADGTTAKNLYVST